MGKKPKLGRCVLEGVEKRIREHSQGQAEMVVGALVLLVDENKPRNSWSLGRVVKVAGDESHVRTVDVRVASGKVFSRDVTKVVHLEV